MTYARIILPSAAPPINRPATFCQHLLLAFIVVLSLHSNVRLQADPLESRKAYADSTLVISDSLQHKQRLSSVVNSYASVVSPVLSYDNRRLYFSRKFYPENTGQTRDPDDVWTSMKDSLGRWMEATNLGSPINTPESNVLCSVTPYSTTALLQTTLAVGVQRVHVFALSHFENGKWSQPEPLHIDAIRNDSRNFYAHLSYDERLLFLALENPQSVGGLDLFVCRRKGTSLNFEAPINLGPQINTKGTEGSPCLGFDGRTLYFSSDGRGGFGSQDLFVSHRLDDSWTRWSEPQNLGTEVNTPFLDHCFSLSSDGRTAMIVSADSLGTSGIFEVEIPLSYRMGPSLVIKPEQTRSAEHDSNRTVANTTSATRSLDFDLHFEYDKAELNRNELMKALSNCKLWHEDSCWVVELDSYTDDRGSESYNDSLAQARALSVRKGLFVSLHQCFRIKAARIHGMHDPRFDNASDEGRKKNRCVRVRCRLVGTKEE